MKLRPNDIVAVGSVVWVLLIGIGVFFLHEMNMWLLVLEVAGVLVILGLNRYENRIYRTGGTLSWLDWMQVRDMMATAHNREAINFILAKAYKMDEKQVMALSPEDLDVLLQKLKTKGGPR